IPQRSLSLLSNRLARGGALRIPEAVLERDYCLAWFLVALSRAPLCRSLAFKGGTALKRCWFGDYRFSEDLDFTLLEPLSAEAIRAGLDPVFAEAGRAAGAAFAFARWDSRSHANAHTCYLAYEGPLPASSRRREIKVDITVRERLVFPVRDRAILRSYPEYADLPDAACVRAYALEEIGAEKIVALLDRARCEPRDLYDTWFLVSGGHVEARELKEAVGEKLAFRSRSLADTAGVFAGKEARLEKLWETRLRDQMTDLPEFGAIFRAVSRALRQAGLLPAAR
ncbi:MAG: nucleotidyl transferase AbiEii/AbiGii toxin family protein, partial [Candidatus Coatesbacteria bacterium]